MTQNTMTNTTDHTQNLEKFIKWFREIEPRDQEELITLVYSEHKVRDMVRTFSSMPVSSNQSGEIEVEWQEWDNSTKT